ncbi:MAG: endonuclease III [Candidatus Dependentiae bacterium]|nr:endonuclease III [Candidatus Dependentiae bacterium]
MKSSLSIDLLIKLLEKATFHAIPPMTQTVIAHYPHDPYPVLISCLLSLRAKDTVTLPVSLHLFSIARTPEQMLQLSIPEIESIIRPVNYYRRKALQLHHVSAELLHRFEGKVPNNLHDLLSIKGVGLKTANLVLAEGFGIPAICVDVHVHRISNRLGIIKTKTVEETERALREVLPEKYWIVWNRLLVMLGQTICTAQSPFCSKCPLINSCQRVDVIKSR